MPPSFVSERSVLKPKDPSVKDNDLWNIFMLNNAEVRDKSTNELVSLLNAHAATPLTVTGRLQPLPPDKIHCLVRTDHNKSTPIIIEDVYEFSYGTDDSGRILIWAAGNAGWFELRPARAYRDIFAEIEEAVNIQFFIEDVYEQGRSKSGSGPSAEMVFRELAEDNRFSCASQQDAAEMVARHRSFLLMQMFKHAKRLAWSRSPLLNYLKTKFPADFQALKSKHEGKVPLQTSKAQNKGKRSAERDVSLSDEPQAEPSQKSAKPKRSISAPKKDAAYWRAMVVWDIVQRTHTQDHVDASTMTIADVANVLYHRYDFESVDLANSFVRAHNTLVRWMMEAKSHRLKKGIQWINMPIYQELGSSRLAPSKQRQAAEVELKARRIALEFKRATPEEEESSAPEPDDREARLRRRAHKGKSSVLRPKSMRFSGKGKGITRPKAPKEQGSAGESESDDPLERTPSKRKGTFGNDLPPTKRIPYRLRNMSAASISSETVTSGADKTSDSEEMPSADSNEEAENDEADEDEEEEDEEGEEEAAPSTISATLPLHLRPVKGPPNSSAAITQSVVSNPLPTFDANQPGDVWLCTFDGCSHRVYGASEPESQELIREHGQKHEEQDLYQRDKLALVMREGELGGRMPVSNLIQRIREMTESQQNILQPAGSVAATLRDIALSEGVKRRY